MHHQLDGLDISVSDHFKCATSRPNATLLHDITQLAVGISIVSGKRLYATAQLTYAALLQEGDVVETGVFRGGSSAVILKVLQGYDDCGKAFWAFDSFQGLPNITKKDQVGEQIVGAQGIFAAGVNEFKANLEARGVWNESRIHIVPGWFSDTVSKAGVKQISFLRLDGDLYQSTIDVLKALYPRVSPGGYIYVDDYGSFNGCRRAVDEYRAEHQLYEPMHWIREGSGIVEAVWWRKRM